MDRNAYSLRRQLLALISLPVILAGIVVGALALYSTYHEIDEVYDVQLVHAAKLLHDLTSHDLAAQADHRIRHADPHAGTSHYYEQKISFRVWEHDRLVAESLSAGDLGTATAPPGFSRQSIGDTEWHFFVHVDELTGITVEVAEHAEIRTELIFKILSSLLLPALVFIPIILLLVWIGVTRSLQPMLSLARQVNRRGADDLTPLEATPVPREIAPFISALNRLFARVERALQTEREFTDNAAHELRTPLAAMKTQAQVLRRQSLSQSPDQEGIDNLLESIDRATRMVEQLLTFSRLQHMQENFAPVDLGAVAREVLAEMAPLALKREQQLRTELALDAKVMGSAAALAVLVRNLVDNAIKYSPRGHAIEVRVTAEQDKAELVVSDQGPGIAPEHQTRVFERFYRIGSDEDSGSGLGLAMARWITQTHQADIRLEPLRPAGLRVRVTFRRNGYRNTSADSSGRNPAGRDV